MYKQPLNPNFIPEPSIGQSYAGTVVPQTPPESEDEWKKPVSEIVKLLIKNGRADYVLLTGLIGNVFLRAQGRIKSTLGLKEKMKLYQWLIH